MQKKVFFMQEDITLFIGLFQLAFYAIVSIAVIIIAANSGMTRRILLELLEWERYKNKRTKQAEKKQELYG